MNRSELIERGKIWHVHHDKDTEAILHEGTRTNCLNWLKANGFWGLYKKGFIRIGKVIWEKEEENPFEGIQKAIKQITDEAKPIYGKKD